MLSRNCDGCSQLKQFKNRFRMVKKIEKVYCPDETTHLVDEENKFLLKEQNIDSKKISLHQ